MVICIRVVDNRPGFPPLRHHLTPIFPPMTDDVVIQLEMISLAIPRGDRPIGNRLFYAAHPSLLTYLLFERLASPRHANSFLPGNLIVNFPFESRSSQHRRDSSSVIRHGNLGTKTLLLTFAPKLIIQFLFPVRGKYNKFSLTFGSIEDRKRGIFFSHNHMILQ